MGLVSLLYKIARIANDLDKVSRPTSKGSTVPGDRLAKRLLNKLVGRRGVSRLWFK